MSEFNLDEELKKTKAYQEAYEEAAREQMNGERSSSSPGEDLWPTLADDALYGLAGDIVRTIDPHTEADP